MTQLDTSKRKFIKAAAYVAPAILTLKVAPTFASGGSGRWNGNPGRSGDGPNQGGGSGRGNGDSSGGDNHGDYSDGNRGDNNSSASASAFNNSPHIKRKKRQWYWPFA